MNPLEIAHGISKVFDVDQKEVEQVIEDEHHSRKHEKKTLLQAGLEANQRIVALIAVQKRITPRLATDMLAEACLYDFKCSYEMLCKEKENNNYVY